MSQLSPYLTAIVHAAFCCDEKSKGGHTCWDFECVAIPHKKEYLICYSAKWITRNKTECMSFHFKINSGFLFCGLFDVIFGKFKMEWENGQLEMAETIYFGSYYIPEHREKSSGLCLEFKLCDESCAQASKIWIIMINWLNSKLKKNN